MKIAIEAAREQDVPLLLRLIEDLAAYEKLPLVTTEEMLRDSLFRRRAAETFIAYAGGEPAGYAMFFQTFSTFLGVPGMYLEDIFVEPRFRRHGIGRLLLTHLAHIAVERGYGRVDWTVLDWNSSAIDFYKGLGAQLMDEWKLCRLTGDSLRKLADSG